MLCACVVFVWIINVLRCRLRDFILRVVCVHCVLCSCVVFLLIINVLRCVYLNILCCVCPEDDR